MSASLTKPGEIAMSQETAQETDRTLLPLLTAPDEQLEEVFRIPEIVEFVTTGGYKMVAVQIPDSMLCLSCRLSMVLQPKLDALEADCFILGDTTFGQDTPDEVAAQHMEADCMIHCGNISMVRSASLPVLSLVPRLPRPAVDPLSANLPDTLDKHVLDGGEPPAAAASVVVVGDANMGPAIEQARAHLAARGLDSVVAPARGPAAPAGAASGAGATGAAAPVAADAPASMELCGWQLHQSTASAAAEKGDTKLVYIGKNANRISHAILWLGDPDRVLVVHPSSGKPTPLRMVQGRPDMLCNKRFQLIEATKSASVVGIIVGTLSAADQEVALATLVGTLRAHGVECLTILVGKPNQAKLGNFDDVDAFVFLSVGDDALILSQTELHKTVISPVEALHAFCGLPWTGRLPLDLPSFLRAAAQCTQPAAQADDAPVFSLASGQLVTTAAQRAAGATGAEEEGESGAAVADRRMVVAADGRIVAAASQRLAGRTFIGVDGSVPKDQPVGVEEGRSGVAWSYNDEHDEQAGGQS